METITEGTGFYHSIDPTKNRIPEPDGSGKHFWIIMVTYKVSPKLLINNPDGGILDSENLLAISVPGCHHCMNPYTTELAATPCVPVE